MNTTVRFTAQSFFISILMIGAISMTACSQVRRSGARADQVHAQTKTSDTHNETGDGQYVTVDGERVFVPSSYIDSRSELMRPEKVARDILRGRKIIEAGNAKTTFQTSTKGTEYAVSSIEFEPGEPQTKREQISYTRERVNAFNDMLQGSGMTANDSAAGAGSAMLIAMKILGKDDPLGQSKAWQKRYEQHILNSEAYQGRADEEKQANYEIAAFFAVEGLNEVKKSKAARSEAEREAARNKARGYAEMIYSFLTKGWPDSDAK